MKTGKWSEEEDALVRELYATYTRKEIAVKLNRNETSVRHRCATLGLNSKAPDKWSLRDLEMLKEWYEIHKDKKLNLEILARNLNRTRHGVCLKAKRLGLTEKARKTGRKDRRKYGSKEDFRRVLPQLRRDWYKKNEHPRGAKGTKLSPENKAKLIAGGKAWRASLSPEQKKELIAKTQETLMRKYGTLSPGTMRLNENKKNPYSRAKHGRRADLDNQFFRSAWEANYARYLNFLIQQKRIQKWEFESETFWFEKIKRGVRSYTPDFKIYRLDGTCYFVEVKGWLDDKSKTKLKRMRIYHPSVELVLFDATDYANLQKQFAGVLPCWE